MLFQFLSFQFSCYYPNSSVTLVSQTKAIRFDAWPATTDEICQTLDKKPFVPQIYLNGIVYTHEQLLFDALNPLVLTLPCLDLVTGCSDAFHALSALYLMQFTENSLKFDATVSEFLIERFDVKYCIDGPNLQVDKTAKKIYLIADFTSCKIVLYNTNDELSVVNFSLEIALFSANILIQLPTTVSLSTLAQHIVMDCTSPDVQGDCETLIQKAESLDQFAKLILIFPLKIRSPYPSEQYRLRNQELYSEVRHITTQEVASHKCIYVSNILLFSAEIALNISFSTDPNCVSIYESAKDNLTLKMELMDQENTQNFKIEFVTNFSSTTNMLWLDCCSDICQRFLKDVIDNELGFMYGQWGPIFGVLGFEFPLLHLVVTSDGVEKHMADSSKIIFEANNVVCASAIVSYNSSFIGNKDQVMLHSEEFTIEIATTVPNNQNLYCFAVEVSTKQTIKNELLKDSLMIFQAMGQFFPVVGYQDETSRQYIQIGGWYILLAFVVSIIFSITMLRCEK